jgi:D-arabinose 1-dehydrogenase-like Zn-dependent alcohol dehydrogenase
MRVRAIPSLQPFSYNPRPLAADFVEIAISHCGICGTDIHVIDSGWRPSCYPVIPGHEIVGRVVAVGADVKNVAVGDRVGVGAQCGSCLNRKDCAECAAGWEQHCCVPGARLSTYNSRLPDGQVTQGGYADRIRLDANFAFKIPESISSAEAAPLMCAGVTVFAPLQRLMTRPNMKVAVIGVGGLGHLAIMFASKLQNGTAEVTAVSHNSKKKEAALQMGAKAFLDTSDAAQVKAAFRKFDLILCTADGKGQDYNNWLSTVKLGGTLCTVGIPNEPMQIAAFALMGAQVTLTASNIGSISEIEQMLAFADKHNVRPIIQRLPMDQANTGVKMVRDGSVRFRVVLENPAA